MKTNKILLLFLAIITFGEALSQRTQIQGTITNKAEVEGIHIMNLSSRINTVSGVHGNFSIAVKEQDTLLFSSVHYIPKKITISSEIVEKGILILALETLVNELDEVYLGPNLTGNLETDLKTIKTEKQIDFDDVGIPGFKGEQEEKIPKLVGQVITPLSLDVEGLYKHISGYYKKLKTQRKWEAENNTIASIINYYSVSFFVDAYQIPEERLYDFLLFCTETSSIQSFFESKNYVKVLAVFDEKGPEYAKRLQITEFEKKE